MASPLAPNRIHNLPVRVVYQVPGSSQAFTTFFSSLQQVYVHPNAAAYKEAEDDVWGSIYLKTIMQGILMASPELHPNHSSVPDLSIYIFDPRETGLRRARSSTPFPVHLRSAHASSPIPSPSSPTTQPISLLQEVWSGKGLVSWALDEAGDGKNLITGRLVRNHEFTRVVKGQGLSPMEALMLSNEEHLEESWGIEVCLCLKSGPGAPIGLHPQVQQVMAMESGMGVERRSSISEWSIKSEPREVKAESSRPNHRASETISSRAPRPLSPAKTVSTTPLVKASSMRPATSLKKASTTSKPHRHLPYPSQKKHHHSSTATPNPSSTSSSPKSFPGDIPAQLYTNPESLTKEQAERLIASPAFLSMLERLTGAPIEAAKSAKRAREAEAIRLEEAKRKKTWATEEQKHSHTHSRRSSASEGHSHAHDAELKCFNCGRTKSAVWRLKVLEDGNSVRVCNACGLYWNKLGSMRPPTLWQGLDEEVRERPRDKKGGSGPASTPAAQTPSSEANRPASRIDSGSFKRTLSAVVEQDARRIASMRTRPGGHAVKSNLGQSSKSAMTSPMRGSTSATKSIRARHLDTIAASSPGWQRPSPTARQSTNTPAPRLESSSSQQVMQTLAMPLSDDGGRDDDTRNDTGTSIWDTDISAYFDFPADSLGGMATHGRSPSEEPTDFHRALSSGARARRRRGMDMDMDMDTEAETEDDVLSQLFNRTSSIGPMGSSPGTFDFSQLPPSSPPVIPSSDLPHSVLLLSSPGTSSIGFSPLDRRISPEKPKSALRQSFSSSLEKTDSKESFDFGEFLNTSLGPSEFAHGHGHGMTKGEGGVGVGVGVSGMDFGDLDALFRDDSFSVGTLGNEGHTGEDWLREFSESMAGEN
ncbi:hypothetical protein BCR39DRAFT_542223 [Naematelia encephala]|uniref:GATA-type domain-containing protein n=1 Tax=Naematelia encephala TaxID=71784 RepID=A0A1Y2AUE1_9TREE|nr:hypothetical protein BCR39DRAFT_542223 [Naematelia encephala]